nr:RecQ family ATP-dependent DNA helicase [Planococcus halocryophilus]
MYFYITGNASSAVHQKKLQEIRVSLLVADEAHCISQWGFDFRPDYLRISEVLPILKFPQVLALTATATDKVTEEIKEYLALIKPYVYCHPMDRKNIVYDIKKFEDSHDKLEFLKAFIQKFNGPGIIYAGTRKKSQELSMLLTEQGISSAYYHGGMDHQDRVFVQQQFQNGEVEWICSTNAFGMGVHIPNIRQVIHFQVPTSIEGYVQEVGRAGRDGLPALATLLYAQGDEALLESLVMDDLPTLHEIEAVFNGGPSATYLIDQGIVRETAFRVITYWMTKLPLAGVKSQIELLRKGKRQQASKVRELISRDSCLRGYIISCFDQQVINKPDNCCVNDGIDYSVFEVFSCYEKKPKPLDWQARLSVILPI